MRGPRGLAIFQKCAASDSSDLSEFEFRPGDPGGVNRGSKYAGDNTPRQQFARQHGCICWHPFSLSSLDPRHQFAAALRGEFKDVRFVGGARVELTEAPIPMHRTCFSRSWSGGCTNNIMIDGPDCGYNILRIVHRCWDHAPTPGDTDGEASNPGPRLRRRGPRSEAARAMRRERRQHLTIGTQPPPATEICEDMKFRILHANIRGWISHAAELTARVRLMDEKPDLICVNETFLNRIVEHI